MSGYEESTNMVTFDYSQYYAYEDTSSAPCDLSNLEDFGKVFLPTVYVLVFILGFLGNSLVVCVLVKHRNQTNLTDICLFNLALSDLLFVLTLPFYAHYSVVRKWTFGDFMCRFASGSHNTGFYSSIFFMVVMTMDRYIVIIHTHKAARYRTVRAGVALSLIVWMLSLSVSLPDFIFTKVNESEGSSCRYDPQSDAWKHYNIFTANILGLMIPLLVMVVCYSKIIPILMKMRSTKKHRVVKLIISIVVAFFIFWAPYNISLFLRFLKTKLPGDECTLEKNLRLSVTLTETFAYTHCCLNPIIYAFVGQKFMRRVLQLLKECVPWIPLSATIDFSNSSLRKSSAASRSSEVTSTFIK
ncbi:C-C chemokine receptor type 4 [Notolabrus celidotus]|uniref:C-C chemokine receptor type 4 n=1 Tax=Notolabrus celidotus TaxID=1203425 RepID=UPI0014900989|nr:C-C chemokine receptor type 4 [Notolabrus celidotus]